MMIVCIVVAVLAQLAPRQSHVSVRLSVLLHTGELPTATVATPAASAMTGATGATAATARSRRGGAASSANDDDSTLESTPFPLTLASGPVNKIVIKCPRMDRVGVPCVLAYTMQHPCVATPMPPRARSSHVVRLVA